MHPIKLKEKISNGDFEVLQNALHFFGTSPFFYLPEIESVQEEGRRVRGEKKIEAR